MNHLNSLLIEGFVREVDNTDGSMVLESHRDNEMSSVLTVFIDHESIECIGDKRIAVGDKVRCVGRIAEIGGSVYIRANTIERQVKSK